MSERFIRCPHCGLPHDAHLAVCPTTGLRIEQQSKRRKPRRAKNRDRAAQQQRMIGQIIDGKYRLEAVIGEGGMSSIYRAEHVGLDRRVAIKVLHPSLAEDPEAIARLRNEAQVVAKIGHPNICEIFDLGRTHTGSPYLVMELLVGQSLSERLKSHGAMHFVELAPLMIQVLAALQSAHDHGILHRDLKPENVFVEQHRHGAPHTAKLLDFGISKSMTYGFQEEQRLTHTGMVMGTPYYMAPEQARGDSGLDQRVDLWAVGVMMYESLTGRRPFVATNYNALLVKILTSRPRPSQKLVPTIPQVVADMLDKSLSKLREDRFQSARAFLDAINRAMHQIASEDASIATRFFRRPPQAQPSHAARGSRRSWEIEDPSTFIDDDFDYDPTQIPGPLREYQPPEPRQQPATYDHYDYDAEPVEPTIRERIRPEDLPPAEPPTPAVHADAHILQRPIRERAASSPDSMSDTDVMKRQPMFSESEKTEVIRPALFSDGEKTKVVTRAMKEQLDNPSHGDRVTSPMPPALPDVIPPPPDSQTRTDASVRRRQRRKEAKTRIANRRPGPVNPRVPRPDPRPDDDEKTTLFNPDLARALRDKADKEE